MDIQEPAREQPAEEAAPAFWRAQGSTTGPVAPAPADGDAPAVLNEETAVKDTALTGPGGDQGEPVMVEATELAGEDAQEPAVPAVRESPVPAAQADAHDPALSAQRWSEILVAFVDDPRGSVKMAADAVDEAIDEFVNSVRARQRTMSSSWETAGTGTEQLRMALRDYRTLWHQVRHLDLGEKTGS
jgi:hypothetical protein